MTNFILSLLYQKNKLKATSVYQVFIGKRTSSTLTYAFFQDLLPYIGIFPTLTLNEWETLLSKLETDHLLIRDDQGYLFSNQSIVPEMMLENYSQMNMYRFGRMTTIGWRLVQYFIQVIAYSEKEEPYIHPLETTPFYTQSVQKILMKRNHTELRQEVRDELFHFFQEIPNEQSLLLAQSLTGGSYTGLTFYQILTEEPDDLKRQLILTNAIHTFFAYFLEKTESIFYELLKQLFLWSLNQSLLETRKLFLKGKSLSEISAIRHLKESTIRDHIIEWSILDMNFPFYSFHLSKIEPNFLKLHLDPWEYSFKEVNQRNEIDFLTFRLYQIERKRQSHA